MTEAGDFNLFSHQRGVVDSGVWAALGAMERNLLVCYWRHAGADGLAWPGDKLLTRETGMNYRNVQRARAGLAGRGILIADAGGDGRGHIKKWRLETPAQGATLSAVETPAQYADLSQENPGAVRRERVAQGDVKGWHGTPLKGGTVRRPKSTRRTQEEHMKNGAGKAGGGDHVVLEFLKNTCKLTLHEKLTQAAVGMTIDVAKALWRKTVNAHPQGGRQAPMAAAVMNGSWKYEDAGDVRLQA